MSEDDAHFPLPVPALPEYRPRRPQPGDWLVTPENLALEFRAYREGWSLNVWRRIEDRQTFTPWIAGTSRAPIVSQGLELVLWSRHFADAPPLTLRIVFNPATRTDLVVKEGGDGRKFDMRDRASLARYAWGLHDPARYRQRWTPLRISPAQPEPSEIVHVDEEAAARGRQIMEEARRAR